MTFCCECGRSVSSARLSSCFMASCPRAGEMKLSISCLDCTDHMTSELAAPPMPQPVLYFFCFFCIVTNTEGQSDRVSFPTAARPWQPSFLLTCPHASLVQRLTADHPGKALFYVRKQDIPHSLVQSNKTIVGHQWMQLMVYVWSRHKNKALLDTGPRWDRLWTHSW